jgi:hypothetical protein
MSTFEWPEFYDPRDHADTCAICHDGECPGVGCVDGDDEDAVEELQRLVRLGRMVDSLRVIA